MNTIYFALIAFTALSLLVIFSRSKVKHENQVYEVDFLTPLPLIDSVFVFNGDQFYYPETRTRYLASGDEWIDISENFRGAVNG